MFIFKRFLLLFAVIFIQLNAGQLELKPEKNFSRKISYFRNKLIGTIAFTHDVLFARIPQERLHITCHSTGLENTSEIVYVKNLTGASLALKGKGRRHVYYWLKASAPSFRCDDVDVFENKKNWFIVLKVSQGYQSYCPWVIKALKVGAHISIAKIPKNKASRKTVEDIKKLAREAFDKSTIAGKEFYYSDLSVIKYRSRVWYTFKLARPCLQHPRESFYVPNQEKKREYLPYQGERSLF